MSKEHLYQVCLKHNKTGDRLNLQVWAQNSDEATHKLQIQAQRDLLLTPLLQLFNPRSKSL